MKNALIKLYGSNLTNHMPTAVPCMGMNDGGYVANFGDVVDWVSGCELAVELLCEMSTNNCITIEGVEMFDLLYDLSAPENLSYIINRLESMTVNEGQLYSFGDVANYFSCELSMGDEQSHVEAIQCATNILKGILDGSIEVKSL